MSDWRLPFGANVEPGGVRFRVWAPTAGRVDVVILAGPDAERMLPLQAGDEGWWEGLVADAGPGTRYRFRLDEADAHADPASRSQPEGVFGPSQVVDPQGYSWADTGWLGRPLEELVIYELHVGTATAEGTFRALIARLGELAELGVTALELMPVAQASGTRNWGYDGVNLFAPSAAYGGSEGLRELVDAAHRHGLAVILDVVYNHLGPEGSCLHAVTGGRFFTDRHKTPWGDGIRYDGPGSAPVREFMVQNALHWAHEYHLDGLRLDATHAIQDDSPEHVIAEMSRRVRGSLPPGRHFVMIAEDERNDPRVVAPPDEGGWGLDAVWADDFHHQVRVRAAGDREGYFARYSGSTADLATTLERGWWRGEAAGAALPEPPRLVHCVQNHDQVGNRALGDRLSRTVEPGAYRAACALLLLSPYTPLLWMGQEWAASSPFLYFTDHSPELGRLVTEGRRNEFRDFAAFGDPASRDRIPDPQAEATFQRSRLDWAEAARMPHAGVRELHRTLLRLRREHPALRGRARESFRAWAPSAAAVALERTADGRSLLLVAAFEPCQVMLPQAAGASLVLSTEETRFGADAGREPRLHEGGLSFPAAGAALLEGPRAAAVHPVSGA